MSSASTTHTPTTTTSPSSSSLLLLPSPFTLEHVQQWASFGPKLKGPPQTPEEQQHATLRKQQCTAMKQRLYEEFRAMAIGEKGEDEWTLKKIEKELDRLVTERQEEGSAITASTALIQLDPPSGTRDFYPAEMRIRNWLFDHFRQTALAFGFQEYDAPVLEHTALYERKAGEEIVDQMYAFVDQEEHRVTLRPEMTPSLARLVLQRTNLTTGECRESLPLKWFSIPQCWRFEATQRGRKREHYQWNMDIVGVEHVHAELELLAAACAFFRRVGVTPDVVGIKINSRAVLESILSKHGIQKNTAATGSSGEDTFAKVCVIIDKLDKIGDCAVTELLMGAGIDESSCQEILAALRMPSIEALAEHVGSDSPAIQDVRRVFQLAQDYGISDYLIFDASVVRGLAYYTGIVWEAFDRRGQLRAIMGGGRYDRLLELYGGPVCQIPCVGFGFGDCVIMELLAELNLVPPLPPTIDYVVCAYSMDLYGPACGIAATLRSTGARVDVMPTPKKKVANSFKHADQTGARRMVFVAPDEIASRKVRIKDLRTKDPNTGEGLQVDIPLDELPQVETFFMEAARRVNAVME